MSGQNMFLWTNMENYPLIILVTPNLPGALTITKWLQMNEYIVCDCEVYATNNVFIGLTALSRKFHSY